MDGKRKQLRDSGAGTGTVRTTAVVGAKDRTTKQVKAKVVESTDGPTLQAFVREVAAPGAQVYTDEAAAYQGIPFPHETVKHSVAEYVRDQAHINGMESFWSMVKRGHEGTFHKMSAKHLQRYVTEFAGRNSIRDQDTIDQMHAIVAGTSEKRLAYDDLVS